MLPVYNGQTFLGEAINSVLSQTERAWNLTIVDDASTDNSLDIARSFAKSHPGQIQVNALSKNRGASAARNIGIRQAQAPLVAFLDADDIWWPEKLEHQLTQLKQTSAAMVFCPAQLFWEDGRTFTQQMGPIQAGLHPPRSLAATFLGEEGYFPITSSALIKKNAIESVGGFEEKFRSVYTDPPLWLKLALEMPIFFDERPLVSYRQHNNSSCSLATQDNSMPVEEARFVRWALEYLSRHGIRDPGIWDVGLQRLDATTRRLVRKNISDSSTKPFRYLLASSREYRRISSDLGLLTATKLGGRQARALTKKVWSAVRQQPVSAKLVPRRRFSRGIAPLSYLWGSDRGVPIHRHYIEAFLRENLNDIRGRVLDFQADTYASWIGGHQVNKVDVWHRNETNPQATIWGDLTQPESVPSNLFDCIICTHVLHLIDKPHLAIQGLYRLLAEDGVLLLTVPQVSMNEPDLVELWRFTPTGVRMLLSEAFDPDQIVVTFYGNSLTTAAELRGYVTGELTSSELAHHDERFAAEVCARAVKI